jgi:hypothetical protein
MKPPGPKDSVAAYTEAAFTLEEAKIKVLVLQELGAPELQKATAERMRSINQLSKLIHDGKTAISGKAVDSPKGGAPAPPEPSTPRRRRLPLPRRRPSLPRGCRFPTRPSRRTSRSNSVICIRTPMPRRRRPIVPRFARELLGQAGPRRIRCGAGFSSARRRIWPPRRLTSFSRSRRRRGQSAAFDVDPYAMKVAALNGPERSAKTPEQFAGLAQEYSKVGARFFEADDYVQAEEGAQRRGPLGETNEQCGAHRSFERPNPRRVGRGQGQVRVDEGVAPGAGEELGGPRRQSGCGCSSACSKGTGIWGLRFLVKGADPALKAAAEKDLKLPLPADGADRRRGRVVGTSAEKEKNKIRKDALQERARVVVPGGAPAGAAAAEARLEKRFDATSGGPVDLLKLIDAKLDFVHGD